jgi:hypothetical protein
LLAVIVKSELSPLDAMRLVDTLDVPAGTVVIAPYLGERTRDVLAERGVSSIDTTGKLPPPGDRPTRVRQRPRR